VRALFACLALFAAGLRAAPLLFIDAGHSAAQPGVSVGPLQEAALSFEVAGLLQAELKARGLECVLSRDAASNPTLQERAALANASGAKAFLSLHFNHSPNPGVHGPRIFIPKSLPPKAASEPRRWESAAGQRADEAKALAAELAKALGQGDGKVSVQALNLAPFRGLNLPALLVELGYLSHEASRQKLGSPEARQELARKLAQGVLAWSGAGKP
jgi:N-acetylmuramoyl-L-alanine amidase